MFTRSGRLTLVASVSITVALLAAFAAFSLLSRPAPATIAAEVAEHLTGNGLYAGVAVSEATLQLERAFPEPCEGAARAALRQTIDLCSVSDVRLIFDEEVDVGIVLVMGEGGATERAEYCDGRVIDGAVGMTTVLWSDKAGFALGALEVTENLERMQGQCP